LKFLSRFFFSQGPIYKLGLIVVEFFSNRWNVIFPKWCIFQPDIFSLAKM